MSHASLRFYSSPLHSRRRYLLYVVLLVLFVYLLYRQLGTLHESLAVLVRAHWRFVGLALAATLVSHFTAGIKYTWLAFKQVRYWPTLVVQLAGLLTSRLLPAGIGGLGVNYLYLRRSKHTRAQAAIVVSVNNVLGIVGNVLLVMVLVAASNEQLSQVLPHFKWHTYWLLVAFIIVLSVIVACILYSRRLRRGISLVMHNLLVYRHRPKQLAGAVLCSALIATCYAAALWYAALALDINLPFVAAFIVMTVGVAVGSATPTPGGLGGAEAGLVAALLAYGLPLTQAVALTLLYRLISFWFSILIGALALTLGRETIFGPNNT